MLIKRDKIDEGEAYKVGNHPSHGSQFFYFMLINQKLLERIDFPSNGQNHILEIQKELIPASTPTMA